MPCLKGRDMVLENCGSITIQVGIKTILRFSLYNYRLKKPAKNCFSLVPYSAKAELVIVVTDYCPILGV